MVQQRNANAEEVVSAAEAKSDFDRLMTHVAETREAVVVERQGEPRAAIISIDDFRAFQTLKKAQTRREAGDQLRKLQAEISARFADLSEEEIEQIAQEVRHEVAQGLIEQGRVHYEE